MTEIHYYGDCPYCKEEVPLNMMQIGSTIESIMSTPGPCGFLIQHPQTEEAAQHPGHYIIAINDNPPPAAAIIAEKFPNFSLLKSELKEGS